MVKVLEAGVELGMHSTTGSLQDTYRLQSGHDRCQQTSMRRERSHAAHRARILSLMHQTHWKKLTPSHHYHWNQLGASQIMR
eukprot:3499437-Karenia_brevis.AAC.1